MLNKINIALFLLPHFLLPIKAMKWLIVSQQWRFVFREELPTAGAVRQVS